MAALAGDRLPIQDLMYTASGGYSHLFSLSLSLFLTLSLSLSLSLSHSHSHIHTYGEEIRKKEARVCLDPHTQPSPYTHTHKHTLTHTAKSIYLSNTSTRFQNVTLIQGNNFLSNQPHLKQVSLIPERTD